MAVTIEVPDGDSEFQNGVTLGLSGPPPIRREIVWWTCTSSVVAAPRESAGVGNIDNTVIYHIVCISLGLLGAAYEDF